MKYLFFFIAVHRGKSRILCTLRVPNNSSLCPEGIILFLFLLCMFLINNYFINVFTFNRWFHSHLNGLDAQRILLDEGVEGSFLVRKSYSRKGQFVLSVR